MIHVEDVINIAKYSELAGLTALKDNEEALVTFINLGMLVLHRRFSLKDREFIIDDEIEEGKTTYDLPSDFMNIIEVGGILKGSDKNFYLLHINESDERYSAFFPEANKKIQIPSIDEWQAISVIYNATPTKIVYNKHTTPERTKFQPEYLEIPDALLDCLCSYIGYRAHMSISGNGDNRVDNNAHWARFDRNCQIVKNEGVIPSPEGFRRSRRLFEKGYI